jgi:hypothetical protein
MKTSGNFEEAARIHMMIDFKKKMNYLRKSYKESKKQFDDLCEELDNSPVNEQYLREITTHLTVHLSEMDIIEQKIKEINEIVEHLKMEISN